MTNKLLFKNTHLLQMLPSLHLHLLSSPSLISLPPHHNPSSSSPLFHLQKPIFFSPFSTLSKPNIRPLLAQGPITIIAESEDEEEGPFELPPSSTSSQIFATDDDPTFLQTATSLLLTGSIGIFLFRSLRRRAKRAKELKFRSSGTTEKSLKEEALDNLKAMGSASIETESSTPSPVQAFLGSIAAGIIALILYKFATTIEASLNRQTISDNFSVRQITVTIRTIINGICYLATFVFGINSLGLFLYSGQLAFNSFMGSSSSEEKNVDSLSSVKENDAEGIESASGKEDQSTGDKQ